MLMVPANRIGGGDVRKEASKYIGRAGKKIEYHRGQGDTDIFRNGLSKRVTSHLI